MKLPVNQIICGDNLEVMRTFSDCCIDTVITDPPYGLGFMGKGWDTFKPEVVSQQMKRDTRTQKRRQLYGGRESDAPSAAMAAGRYDFSRNAEFQQWFTVWAKEVLRIAKPGAIMLIFGGTRTYHRLTCAIEDAGWQIRDCMMWLYGSGFPKSLDISKAIDKAAPRQGMFEKFAQHFAECRKLSGLSQKDVAQHFPSKTGGFTGCVWNWENGSAVPTVEQWHILQPMLKLSNKFLPLIERIQAKREIIGKDGRGKIKKDTFFNKNAKDKAIGYGEWDITKSATDLARLWDGWGTALKPGWEPIIVAMKPLEGTFAQNAEKHGVAGLNIDGGRIGTEKRFNQGAGNKAGGNSLNMSKVGMPEFSGQDCQGRWPANVILDEEAGAMLDEQSGVLQSGDAPKRRNAAVFKNCYGEFQGNAICPDVRAANSGGASRFFKIVGPEPCFLCGYLGEHGNLEVGPGVYLCDECLLKGEALDLLDRFLYCAKASRAERNAGLEGMEEKRPDNRTDTGKGIWVEKGTAKQQNSHPTVKPLKLMEYLCILTKTPTRDIVLDCFGGSGTTAMACVNTDRDYILIEKDPEYVAIAEKRVVWVKEQRAGQMALFGEVNDP